MNKNTRKIEFQRVSFRRMSEDCEIDCDYCGSSCAARWYNELFVMGLCDKCIDEIVSDYEKDGGG
jgi:hypothetical protein